ncbi:formate dehydrogenase [Paucibacter sp. AS339]|uniref:formate dehydrogenase n=1 Tax=Paucibacter hankyongi TaxID=3133434 RepID=UPI0030B6E433
MSKKQLTDTSQTPPLDSAKAEPSPRRGWLLGLGAAGAGALAVKVLPGAAVEEVAVLATPAVPEARGGYQLSPHVLRYYETARS